MSNKPKKYRHYFSVNFYVDSSTMPWNAGSEELAFKQARLKLKRMLNGQESLPLEYVESEDLEEDEPEAVNYFLDLEK